ncbi:MAG: translocation/assembly module TamB domain-containing protein [Acidobacteriota bacterium]
MRRAAKIALWTAAGLAALALVAAVAALITVRTSWFREKVRARIVYELESATGGKVELGRFDFDWRALRATAHGLVVRGAESPEQPPLFRAESVEVALKVVSILKKDVDVESLTVGRPEVNLIVYPDGRTNLPEPKAARAKSPVEQIFDLAIGRFRLDGGAVQVGERRLPLDARGEDLRARFFYEMAGPRYRGELAMRKLHFAAGQAGTLPLDVEAKLALARNRLELTGVRVAFQQSELGLSGAVEDFVAPRAELALVAHLRLNELAPALRLAQIPRRGEVTFDGRLAVSRAAGYALNGRLRARGLLIERGGFRLENASVSSAVALTPEKLELRDLAVSALGGSVTGRAEVVNFRRFSIDASLRGLELEQLEHLDRVRAWSGTLAGALRASGEIRDGQPRGLEAQARLEISPGPGPNPLRGLIDGAWRQDTGAVTFGESFLATRSSRVEFSGVPGRRIEVALESSNLNDLRPVLAEPLPVSLVNGAARFRGVATGPLGNPQLDGRASLTSFVAEGRRFDSLDAEVVASRTGARAQRLRLTKDRMTLTGNGQIGLENWKPAPASPIRGAFSLDAPDLTSLLAEAGQQLPAGGEVSTTFEVSGTLDRPQLNARVTVLKGAACQQPFDRLQAEVRYGQQQLEVRSGQVWAPPGRAQFSVVYTHAKDRWRQGRLKFQLSTPGIQAGRVKLMETLSRGLDGSVAGQAAGEAEIAGASIRLRALDGKLALRRLTLNRRPLGSLDLAAATSGSGADVNVRGEIAGASIRGESQWRLDGDYPVRGTIQFTRMEISNLLARFGAAEPFFRGFAEGALAFAGSALDPESWKADLELPVLEIRPGAAPDLTLHNTGPVSVAITSKGARIREARLAGKGTDLAASGAFAFGAKNGWDLRVQGGLDLALLRDYESRLQSAGRLALDATVRGPLAQPDLYGRVELQNAAFNYGGFPNGLDKVNGVLLLFRDRATIEKLTAESGGGKVSLSGFIGFGRLTTYSIQANAEEVRVRYPEGVSSTMNAALTFTGTAERSLLGGGVTVTRAAFNPQTDLGSMLARALQPPPPPVRPNRFLEGMRFDVRIQTSPQARFETTLTRGVQAEADLRLRGEPARPALVGRVLVNQGEVLFFGNQYDIESGEVLFVNPARIEPVVNLHLQTRVRGIEVTLNINGPLGRPGVTYRSDPPLPFSDIVALLATGRAPAATPGLAGARSELSQSWEQAGASALVSQAIASPLAGRLQRFFGVSRLTIDPSVVGVENTPEARVTVEQQITQDLTLTYITNLARAQHQTIRLEWDFTRNFSALAVREANGLFGVDFLYKKRFK